ncbi:Imm50 family immunity protein [Rahnella selenatireducens]|uniref:Imm50 family immunity protein n=1 Tax=Rahnella selenatireducens TaxID=3389797 RepID=UPI00396808ED
MWFQNAIGKEKIEFMFNNEFNIQPIEINFFSLGRFSDLNFHFCCKNLPKKHPEKWDKKRFNALNLVVTFGDVIKLDISGSRVGFFCSPTIVSLKDYSEIKIKCDDLNLHCKSKFLTIEEITPYLDERWD